MAILGIDVGGTFTDFVANWEGKLFIWKVPTTQPPSSAVLQGLRLLEKRTERIVHGTTIATNAILEGKWAKTALLTTEGFRDVLEIGRQARPSLYDLFCERPTPIVPREWRLEVPERLDAQGRVIKPLDERKVRELARKLKGQVESVAVVFLFSFRDPRHEERVREILEEEGINVPITLSSEVLPEFREYERTSTTVITAALRPLVESYLEEIAQGLGSAKFLVMRSNGGVSGAREAGRKAAELLFSGPAGGVIGARFVAEKAGFKNLITLDMGGTSTDVSLVENGEIKYTTEKEIAGRPARLPMVDVHTVGAGGGSIAWFDSGGMLRVGPQSAGANPGPACYRRGGTEPTVTDAHLALGHLPSTRPLAGTLALSRALAEEVLSRLAKKLGMNLSSAAQGILDVAEATMERAIRVISIERGYDPRDFVLVAFGGAGPLHAASLARKLGISKVLIPCYAGVLSALGLITADIVHTFVRSLLVPLASVPVGTINALFAEMRKEAESLLRAEEISEERWEFFFSLDLRYRGQGFEIPVPIGSFPLGDGDFPSVVEEFHCRHGERYGFSNRNAEIELVNLRLRAVGRTEKPELPEVSFTGTLEDAVWERRWVHFAEEGKVRAPVFSREKLPAGAEFPGPAVVEGPESTVLIPPGCRAFVDRFGNLILEV
jgi:N-methylhydantoinase A